MISLNKIFSVKNKVIIVTGGSGFLGIEFSKCLSTNGARVISFSLSPPKSKSVRINFKKVDITNPQQVKIAISKVIKNFKKIDVLINNAALNPSRGNKKNGNQWSPYEQYPLELWEKELRVGLTGTQIMTASVAPFMKKQRNGSIINISSIYGLTPPDNRIYDKGKFKSIAYATVKGGLINFTRAWASYLGPYNIRVNALAPGGVLNGEDKKFVKKYSEHTMLNRMVEKSELNGAIIYLASNAASAVTGSILTVDGGWSAK